MTDYVQVRGRNHLLDGFADGTVKSSCSILAWNTMVGEYVSFNCALRPDQG
ncbi:MAG: hypothetical protein QF718_04345 [Phycisphaerales bacterium]|jgi:hypothetical protein|nr:hypothetical protein [Phycisphaerales bacterium]